MSLQDVKTLIGIDDNSKDDVLSLIIRNAELQLMGRFQELELTAIPEALDYIVTEVSIIRYNRLGSEGKSQESVEGFSSTYTNNDFTAYESAIESYLNSFRKPQKGVIRFI